MFINLVVFQIFISLFSGYMFFSLVSNALISSTIEAQNLTSLLGGRKLKREKLTFFVLLIHVFPSSLERVNMGDSGQRSICIQEML